MRTRVRRDTRAERGNWSFDQLGQFIEYKLALYGGRFREVNPRYTSQRCAACGHIEKANRRSQSEFLCQACGALCPCRCECGGQSPHRPRPAKTPPAPQRDKIPTLAGSS
ncbi:MAG: transposase [Chloroflexota bacterium]